MLNKAKWGIFFTIPLVVLVILGIPYSKIGFDSDTLGLIAHFSNINTPRELLHSMAGRMEIAVFPLNFNLEGISIFSYYRPLYQLIFYLSTLILGLNAYAHFLFNIFLHGLVSSFVYIIFSKFLKNIWALLLALVFAFHPALGQLFLGSFMNYIQCYFIFAIFMFLYCEFIESDKYFLYVLSAFFYLISLFIYEMPFFTPVISLLYFLLYDFRNSLKRTWLLFVANAIYFLSRVLILGLPSSYKGSGVFSAILNGVASFRQVAKPFWGLSSCDNVLLIMVSSLFFCALISFFIFAKFDKKKLMLFYLLSFLIASWVLFTGGSETRYLYMALPFFCLIFFELLIFVADFLPQKYGKPVVVVVLIGFVGWGILYTKSRLTKFEKYTHLRDKAFENLAKQYKNKNLKIIFIGKLVYCNDMVFPLGSGMMQAARLYLKNSSMEVYDVLEVRYYSKRYPKETFMVRPVPGGYRFTSTSSKEYSITCSHQWEEGKYLPFSMGKILVNKKFSKWQASDISFTFDKKWLSNDFLKNTVFLTWDMVKERFIELDKTHLIEDAN